MIYLKAATCEYIFTDKALIVIKESSENKSRHAHRHYYRDHHFANVRYCTAGGGIGDIDVELQFTFGSEAMSIDVAKAQIETVQLYARVLNAVAYRQQTNRAMYELAKQTMTSMSDYRLYGQVDAKTVSDMIDVVQNKSEMLYNKYCPESYLDVFMSYLGNM